LEFERICSTR